MRIRTRGRENISVSPRKVRIRQSALFGYVSGYRTNQDLGRRVCKLGTVVVTHEVRNVSRREIAL